MTINSTRRGWQEREDALEMASFQWFLKFLSVNPDIFSWKKAWWVFFVKCWLFWVLSCSLFRYISGVIKWTITSWNLRQIHRQIYPVNSAVEYVEPCTIFRQIHFASWNNTLCILRQGKLQFVIDNYCDWDQNTINNWHG